MSIPLTFMAARQNPASPTVVLWGGGAATTTSIVVLIATKRLDPEESDQALSGAFDGALRFVLPSETDALLDDVSPAGEPRYYAVVAVEKEGERKPLRFRAGAMSQPPERTVRASSVLSASVAPPQETAPETPSSLKPPVPAPEPRAEPPAPTPDARRAAQKRAQALASASEPAPREPSSKTPNTETALPRPSSDYPIERFGLRMSAATQTWDGLRVQWEDEGREVEAFEVVVAGHPLDPNEVAALLRGEAVSGAWVRVFPPAVRKVIDNVTAREARGYYAVIAREAGGGRTPIGCVAQGWDECRVMDAPFFNPDDTEEARDLANGQVREARIQLMLWREDEDVGAWREALRLVNEALAIHPQFQAAIECKRDIEAARTLA